MSDTNSSTHQPNTGSAQDLILENFIHEATEAVIIGKTDISPWVKKYALNDGETEQFIRLVKWLYSALVPVKPSRRFSHRLKQDLMGMPQKQNMAERIRHLPPRVQIAAGVALFAGVMLLARRRVNLPSLTDTAADQSVAIAQ